MKGSDTFDLFSSGLLLGSAQVALFFHLLVTNGAAIILPFLLIAIWLGGCVTGVIAPCNKRYGIASLTAAIVLFGGIITFQRMLSFSAVGAATIYVCALMFGTYGGFLLKYFAAKTSEIRRVLLHENNGFVLGYVASSYLILESVQTLEVAVVLLAVLILIRLFFTAEFTQQSGS